MNFRDYAFDFEKQAEEEKKSENPGKNQACPSIHLPTGNRGHLPDYLQVGDQFNGSLNFLEGQEMPEPRNEKDLTVSQHLRKGEALLKKKPGLAPKVLPDQIHSGPAQNYGSQSTLGSKYATKSQEPNNTIQSILNINPTLNRTDRYRTNDNQQPLNLRGARNPFKHGSNEKE